MKKFEKHVVRILLFCSFMLAITSLVTAETYNYTVSYTVVDPEADIVFVSQATDSGTTSYEVTRNSWDISDDWFSVDLDTITVQNNGTIAVSIAAEPTGTLPTGYSWTNSFPSYGEKAVHLRVNGDYTHDLGSAKETVYDNLAPGASDTLGVSVFIGVLPDADTYNFNIGTVYTIEPVI
ncbi:hypothetical protein IMZ31_23860 (plasmid) [Pontibacillus sp. ALD_SL1]|uniref:hypothetical protein n=1 Tax=Pontibacillus sp. ALD_SL1 TaxID=2777185 RepID=UPI001A96018F|nr:hypothetical protein [Pontibacillus sp. ALD_SL1]QST02489.1 hypothetical protein IMZ31_23860 [Pontibacillus sp. ALD_SL1]